MARNWGLARRDRWTGQAAKASPRRACPLSDVAGRGSRRWRGRQKGDSPDLLRDAPQILGQSPTVKSASLGCVTDE